LEAWRPAATVADVMPRRPLRRTLVGVVVLSLMAAGEAFALTPAGDPAAGAQVFVSAGCTSCHVLAAAGSTGAVGPNLDMTQPTPERVQSQVVRGGGAMPAFGATLTSQQISDVAEYVAQASRGWRPPPANPAPTIPTLPSELAPPVGDAATRAVARVTLTEWRVTARPRSVPEGLVTVTVRNAGRRTHQLVVLRTKRSARALSRIGSRVREVGRLRAVTVVAGSSRRITVTLTSGSYLLISNRPNDVKRGMALRVAVAAPATLMPSAPAGPSIPAGNEPSPAPATPPVAPAAVDGKALFQGTCGGCHTLADAGTTGRVGPNLTRLDSSSAQVAGQIRQGDPPDMPAFGRRLSEDQITAIAEYVASSPR
jgi:cytochrome c6